MKAKLLTWKKTFIDFVKTFKWWQALLFLSLIAFALYFRIDNLFNLGMKFDTVETQFRWGDSALNFGYGPFWNLYKGFFDYLPGALLYLLTLAGLSRLVDPIIPGGADYSFVFVLKLFNTIADLAFAVFIYAVAKRRTKLSASNSALIAGFVFALPSFWFVSSVWGQFDTLVVLMGILSVTFLYKSSSQENVPIWKNYAFWSGIIFAIGFWLKVQIMIIVPVLLIYYFGGKSTEFIKKTLVKIVLWLAAFAAIVAVSTLLYFKSDNYYFGTILLLAGFFGTALYKAYKATITSDEEGKKLYFQSFGFWAATWLIAFIPVVYNPALVFFNVGGPFVKGDNITNGASTFWPLVGLTGYGTDKIFNIYNFGPSVSLTGMLIYAIALIALYLNYVGFRVQDFRVLKFKIDPILNKLFAKRLAFIDFVILMSVNAGFYFMFMTKMHSRYLIWSILFSLVAAVLLIGHKRWKLWIALTLIMHFGYFLNQLGVYNAWAEEPRWTDYLADTFKFNMGVVSSLCNLIAVLGMYSIAWLKWKEER